MTEQEQWDFIETRLSNKWWRLNNLYKVENEDGELVTFKLRPAQALLFKRMRHKNIVLKARQLGFSTAIDIYLLDEALFNNNIKCGIIAQERSSACISVSTAKSALSIRKRSKRLRPVP